MANLSASNSTQCVVLCVPSVDMTTNGTVWWCSDMGELEWPIFVAPTSVLPQRPRHPQWERHIPMGTIHCIATTLSSLYIQNNKKHKVQVVQTQQHYSGQPLTDKKTNKPLRAESTTCYAPFTTNENKTFKGVQQSFLVYCKRAGCQFVIFHLSRRLLSLALLGTCYTFWRGSNTVVSM